MKSLILIVLLFNPLTIGAIKYSPAWEVVYSIVTDCNDYTPIEPGYGQECD
jgi:hypothetical protein